MADFSYKKADAVDNASLLNDGFNGATTNSGNANNGRANSTSGARVNSSYQMNSIFDTDTSEVSRMIIETANLVLQKRNIKGQANAVSISGSDIFKGVSINMTDANGTTYSQAIVIDERPLRTVGQLQEDAKINGTSIFVSALLTKDNSKYLKEFNVYQKDAVVMEPLALVAQTILDQDKITEIVHDVFKRMEAKPFGAVSEVLNADRSKQLIANTAYDGQNVRLLVTHKESAVTVEDLILGTSSSLLDISTRVEPTIGLKKRVVDNQSVDAHSARPVIFIKDYNKPKTFAKFNLEYGLLAIIASTVMAKRDKTIYSLLPSQKHKTNIGALNPIFKIFKDKQGQYPELAINDTKAPLDSKITFIDDLCTVAGLGLDIKYRATASAYTAFATLVDANASTVVKSTAAETIKNAIKNVTGETYEGEIIERSWQYPAGLIVDSSGGARDLSTVDAVWLASNGEIDLASRWIISDTSPNSMSEKIDILTALTEKYPELEIKPSGAGIKIILSTVFIQHLVRHGRTKIETSTDLDIPSQQSTFASIGDLGLTSGFDTVGYTYGGSSRSVNFII